MKLDSTQISNILLGETDPWIEVAREDAELLEMHYYGTGLSKYLEQVEGLESTNQKALRDKFAISNRFLVANLLGPLSNIFKAGGGSLEVDIRSDSLKAKFLESLKDVKSELSLDEYVQNIWKDRFITDPNGLVFLELSKDGSKKYFTQKTIFNIRNMKLHGLVPEYVVFEPNVTISDKESKQAKPKEGEEQEESVKFYWVVDDENYYRVRVKGQSVTKLTKADSDDPLLGVTTKNSFSRVPAIVNSPIMDTKRKIKISPIWDQVELLNSYVVDNSIKEIFKKKFGFPLFWMYSGKKVPCAVCKGAGEVGQGQRRSQCNSCSGSGELSVKRDVSDVHLLNTPTSKDSPVLNTVAGYVSADVKSWEMMNEELDRTHDIVHFSLWHTTVEKHGSSRETATGRFLDVQPVRNKLNDFADIAEKIYNKLGSLWGEAELTASSRNGTFSFKKTLGRRFIIETPDQLWEKYQKSKGEVPEPAADLLLIQFYEAEFQSNELLRNYYIKTVEVDPFPHMTVDEVTKINGISETEKATKIYFHEWLRTLEKQKFVEMDEEVAKALLLVFATQKTGVGAGGEDGATPEKSAEEDKLKKTAQAQLKGSVGGVQGILGIQAAIKAGGDRGAAVATLMEIYGFNKEIANKLLGEIKTETNDKAESNAGSVETA